MVCWSSSLASFPVSVLALLSTPLMVSLFFQVVGDGTRIFQYSSQMAVFRINQFIQRTGSSLEIGDRLLEVVLASELKKFVDILEDPVQRIHRLPVHQRWADFRRNILDSISLAAGFQFIAVQ